MDNVESVLNLQNYLPVDKCQLVYVDDPVVYPFPNNLKLYKGDTLVIEVTHFFLIRPPFREIGWKRKLDHL
jgi:hypothetical protein